MLRALPILLFLLLLMPAAVQTALAEPITGPWEVIHTPNGDTDDSRLDGHSALYAIENGCVAKHYPSGPVQARWCSAPRGGPLNAIFLRGVLKGHVWIGRMGTDGNYRFTYDGTFIDVVPNGAEILGPGVGRQVFVFGDDGHTHLLGEGGAQLADLPGKLTVGPTDSRGGTYVFPADDAPGPLQRVMPSGDATTFGSEIGQAAYVVLDGHDNVFVADATAQVIRVFSPTGKQVQTIGAPGSGPGQLSHPLGIALGGDGTVYVADRGNNRVQQFTAAGQFIKAWGEQGTGPGKFNEPRLVAYDPEGFLIEQDMDGRAQRMRILLPHWPGYQWPVVPQPEAKTVVGGGAEQPAP